MKNNFFSTIFKIFILTGVFFMIINFSGYMFNKEKENIELNSANEVNASSSQNISTYVNKNQEIIGSVGVAVTTNIGTRFKQTVEIPVEITTDNVQVQYALSNNQTINDSIITPNMTFIFEYLNVIKTDVKALLANSTDRSFTLNSFIAQLEYRYTESSTNLEKLNTYRTILVNKYNENQNDIEDIKNEISKDFVNFDTTDTTQNIDDYLDLKQTSTNYKTYVIFIDKLITLYSQLNNYNKGLLDVLINNKEALVKNSYIVIPDNGASLLKDLNLIYDEAEFKSGN